jgi:uncharacterized membrane protein
MGFLWGFFILDFTIEVLEVVYAFYEHGHHWSLIGPLLSGPLYGTYVIGQVLILSVIPFLILAYVVISNVTDKPLLYLANLSSSFLVLQVLFMRFNVVIGGQYISKSDRGFADFHFELFAKEGVLTALIILALPFMAYYIMSKFIPIFDDDELASGSA